MNRKIQRITATACALATALAAASTWVSCSKTIDQNASGTPSGGQPPMMRFSSEMPNTKAFITKTMLEREGTILRLADIVTINGQRNFFFGHNAASPAEQGSDLFRYTDGDWLRYVNASQYGGHYYWTERGTHKFFGWVRGVKLEDNDPANTPAELMFNNASDNKSLAAYQLKVTDSPSTLQINSTTLTDDVIPQFDFIYTDVVMRNLDNPSASWPTATNKYGPVLLNFHHLFSALAITIENQSPQNLVVTDLKIQGLKTSSNASITFNDVTPQSHASPAVAIPTATGSMTEVQGGFIKSTITGTVPPMTTSGNTTTYSKLDVFSKTIVKDATGNITSDGASSLLTAGAVSQSRLIWPQDVTKLTLTLSYKDSEDATDIKTKAVELDYTEHDGGDYHLGAGEKYRINLVFLGDNVPLNCRLNVLPWESVESTLDFAIECNPSLALSYTSATGETPLTGEDYNQGGHHKKVLFPNLNETYIKCTFTPVKPQMGDWVCEIEDGYEYFTFTDAPDSEVPASGNSVQQVTSKSGVISGDQVTLYLRPTGNAPVGSEATCSLRFSIRSGDVEANATALFNPENYLFSYTRQQ